MADYRWPSSNLNAVPDRIPEPRVVTLNPSSLRLLRALGIEDHLESRCMTPFENMVIYEQVGRAALNFKDSEQNMGASIETMHL